ncbi:hypothetical protein [Streptomyces sp. NPDC048252]|uniref:hypothetical protein n=1 Tax=Streptomyces sp. NPDC048252 TaxID=3154612 RepID=UPI00343CA1A1
MAVVAALGQEVARGLVSRPTLHGSAEATHPGELTEFVGAGGELLLLLEALLLGFRGSLIGGELVLDDGVGLRVVRPAGGGEQLRDAFPLADFGGAAFVVGQVLAVAVKVLMQPGVLERGRGLGGGHVGGARRRTELRPIFARSTGWRARARRAQGCGDGGGMRGRRPR